MRRGRFAKYQIADVLREHKGSREGRRAVRKHYVSDATFYNSNASFGGMTISDAVRLRTLANKRGG